MSSPIGLDFYDAELRAHHEHLRAAYGIRPGDEVLDIGCGRPRLAARPGVPRRPDALSGSISGNGCSSALESSQRSSGSRT